MAFDKRYYIGEVSEMTGLPTHVLRQWEDRYPQLRPKRDRNDRRYYVARDIELIKRIQYLTRHEKLKSDGARLRLSQELYGIGKPKTNTEIIAIVDRMQDEIRAMLDLLDSSRHPK